MLGNSFCVPVISFLCGELLLHESFVSQALPPELGLAIKIAPRMWSSVPSFKPGEGNTQSSRELVWEHLRIAERGGSDVRLDINIPFRPKAWPRAGVRSTMWNWAIVNGFPWKHKAHINALEMHATLNAIKWRARNKHHLHKRFLHLIDSQVCAAILTKGRTGSRRLRGVLKKINALILTCGFSPCYCFVHTDDNPADVPSRWGAGKNRFKQSSRQKRTVLKSAKLKAS